MRQKLPKRTDIFTTQVFKVTVTQLKSLEPMIFVKSVPRSIEFYEKLGFEVGNTFTPSGRTEPSWASLHSGGARFMVSTASDPADASQQAFILYLYCEDVASFHQELQTKGIGVGEIAYPFYNPRGEFRVADPDGFGVIITHT